MTQDFNKRQGHFKAEPVSLHLVLAFAITITFGLTSHRCAVLTL